MKAAPKKIDVGAPGGWTLKADALDVIGVAGLAVLAASYLWEDKFQDARWLGFVLIAVWVVATIVNVYRTRPDGGGGGGT